MCLKKGNAYAALKYLRLAKSIDHRFWWFQSPLRAFEHELKKSTYVVFSAHSIERPPSLHFILLIRSFSDVFVALEDSRVGSEQGYDTLERAVSLLDMEANEVGELCRCFRDGALIQKFVRMLPRVDVACSVHPITSNTLR
jgi:hypothetical protein